MNWNTMSRRGRENQLLRALEDGTYQEVLDGDLVATLVEAIEASHKREDAIYKICKSAGCLPLSLERYVDADQIIDILDGDRKKKDMAG
jgi:hypothetical protein